MCSDISAENQSPQPDSFRTLNKGTDPGAN